ncbi:MAG: hypothetical protein IKS02_04730 [Fibrobacter sp.]|nr:hypothetical protein [Fibrobacter sp.]
MKRLSCVVGFAFALGAVAPLVAEDLPSHIDVVIVSASSSSLENGGSSSSSQNETISSASVEQNSSSSLATNVSSSAKQNQSSSSVHKVSSSSALKPASSSALKPASSASVAPASSASAESSSSVKQSSSSRSLDDSPLLPVISHDTLRSSLPENGEASMALPRNIPAAVEQGEGRWFDLQGRLLKGKPTVKGTYYHNGKAVVVK